jgi:cysteine-rich repeat protein
MLMTALGCGLVMSCVVVVQVDDDGPSECIGGDLCVGDLVCVDGFCVPSDDGTGESGDGDPDDGESGDGDGDLVCGNGVEDPGEACDDGNDDNTDTCLDTCELASCGDGHVGPGEGCDDGNMVDDDDCTNGCALTSCGDGVTQAPEQCDDENADDTDECLSTCVSASCGDGFIHQGVEGCDDGNPSDVDACLSTCVDASCGDGFVQAGIEDCDDANMADDDACVTGCVMAECGDGLVEQGVEDCDDANMANDDTCVDGCIAASCGDGFVGPGEGCDDANLIDDDACSNDCSLVSCGDGVVQLGEDCDDADPDNTDACLDTCVVASCGDSFVQQGVEDCDDGNANDDDACLQMCVAASCGDGFVEQGVEVCDDGNLDNTDACLDTCVATSCGDGVLQPGEDCDNGNDNDDHADCTDSCQVAVCGDALMWVGVEECDDGNMIADDGCDACDGASTVAITRGGNHTCLMLPDGSIRCWGSTSSGALGNGVNDNMNANIGDGPGEMPTTPIDVGGVAMQLHTGGSFNCVLLDNGELRCWGHNASGQLGHGNTNNVGDNPGEMPPPPTNVGGEIAQLALGSSHACVLLVNGQVRCWGYNASGQLGQGHTNDIGDGPGEMPPPVVNVGAGNVVQLSVGGSFGCVLLDTNKVRCWGRNNIGALGLGHTNEIGDGPGEMPPPDLFLGGLTITQLGAAQNGNCVLYNEGTLRCWGYNSSGQLGRGHTDTIGDAPGEMPPLNTNYGVGVVSGLYGANEHYQILLADGSVRTWGNAVSLGYGGGGSKGDQPGEMPTANVSLGGSVIALSKGVIGQHNCAVLQDMTVRCWGHNATGQLGYGNALTIGDEPNEMPPQAVPAF